MNRRYFLLSLGAANPLRAAARKPVKIRRIVLTPIQGRFHKFVTVNAYDKAPKGHTYDTTLVRIQTDQGVEGVGTMSYDLPDDAFLRDIRALLGADPLALYEMESGRVVRRAAPHEALLRKYKHLDSGLFDLIGKLQGVPCWKLLGAAVREKIEVYDGTALFSDVWFRDRGVRAVVEEAEEAARMGYLGVKFKVGRGWRWMEKEEGLRRDIEVMQAVRQAVGPEFKILADANNGYEGDFERAWRFLRETSGANLFWIEEIFRENVENYVRLRERMAEAGLATLIADGESVRDVDAFDPYLQPRRLVDVLQMDIRRGGFVAIREMARRSRAAGAVCVPHNWGSQIGLLMGLHVAKAVENVTFAEDDRSTCDAIVAEGYAFANGRYSVPDAPGLGIRVNEEVYRQKYRDKEVVAA